MEDRRRCTAKTSGSGYKERCRKAAIIGGNVCRTHGGAAPQVKQSAKQRLLALADPAVGVLQRALDQAERKGLELHPGLVKVALAVLDRTGLPAGLKIEVEQTGSSAWLNFATPDEKRTILGIMEKCQRRSEKAA